MGKLIRDLVLALLAVLAFCCIVELGLRATGTHFQASFDAPDRELGYVHRPNSQGWNVWENENFVRITADGLRDREHSLQRDPNVIRIAVLGDSITEGKEVPLEQDFCSVLEHELNSRLAGRGLRAEVLNFSVGGYDLAQDYLLMERSVWRFDPQIVILANMTGIVTLRSTRKLYVGPVQYGTPFFVLRKGQLTLDDQTLRERGSFPPESRTHAMIAGATNSLRSLALIHAGLTRVHDIIGETKALLHPRPMSKDAGQYGPYAEVLRVEQSIHQFSEAQSFAKNDPDLAEAWQVSEAIMLKARDSAAIHHAQLWLFALDISFQVDPDRNERAEFDRRFGSFSSDRKLAEFASQSAIPNSMLGPDMAAYAEQHNVVLHGFPGRTARNTGHLNAIGHYVVGHLMAQRLWGSAPLLQSGKTAISSVRVEALDAPN
jgi:hypothetical protein